MSVYSASKAALRSLARTLSAELVGRRIRVNAVSPGPIETPIYGPLGLPAEAQQEMAASFTDRVPLKRFGNPDEIASAVLFLWELYPIVTRSLSTAESSYVLGHELVVDGGMTQL